jgi:hypothetical protein
MRLLSPLAAACLLALAAAPAQAEVFINELHYDDSTAAGDVGEAHDHEGGEYGERVESSHRVYLLWNFRGRIGIYIESEIR